MNWDIGSLSKGLSLLDDKAEIAIRMYAETQAKDLEAYAKKEAKWIDRSGRARGTLQGTARRIEKGYRIELGYNVNYGIWLELANNKNYAVVAPTINLKSPEVLAGLQKLLDKIG